MNNKPEPKSRFATRTANLAIAEKFKWPREDWMQDWPLEIWKSIDIAFCLREYPKLVDEDEKFLLMEGILYALDEVQDARFEQYSQQVTEFLKRDFHIHQYTIYYWTRYKNTVDIEYGFAITPLMRNIWDSQ